MYVCDVSCLVRLIWLWIHLWIREIEKRERAPDRENSAMPRPAIRGVAPAHPRATGTLQRGCIAADAAAADRFCTPENTPDGHLNAIHYAIRCRTQRSQDLTMECYILVIPSSCTRVCLCSHEREGCQ